MTAPSSRPEVTIPQGTFRGVELSDSVPQTIEAFYNIPYAQSTSGQNRFRPPVPIGDSSNVFEASEWGQRPPTMPMPGANLEEEGENCLNLNVFRPKAATKENLPVVILFNGGAFNLGSARMRQLSNMVGWSSEPLLGVSFNYRVNAFGFLPCKLMAKEGCLNIGLKDQALLLDWVSSNIGAFGGDASNITCLGYSAGAHSVGHHMMNPYRSAPLFHKAIMESGAPTARSVYPYDHPLHEAQAKEFFTILKCQNLPEEQILPFLQSLPWQRIRDAAAMIFMNYNFSMRWPFQPCIDGPGGIIPVSPLSAWHSGNWHKMPILTGFCTNEGSIFVPAHANTNNEFKHWFSTLLPTFKASDLDALDSLYSDPTKDSASAYKSVPNGRGKQYARLSKAYGDFAYIAPVQQTSQLASTSTSAAPVYLYEFGVIKDHSIGARHSDHSNHVDYAADTVEASETNEKIAAVMHSYWTSFVALGDPNAIEGLAPGRPKWEVHLGSEGAMRTGRRMVLGLGNDEIAGGGEKGVVAEMRDCNEGKEEREFWWSRVPLSEGQKEKL